MVDQDARGRVTALEEALRRRTADLQAGQERLNGFVRTLTEDVRGPLGLIVSFAQLLEEDYASLSDEDLHRYLRIIVQRGREMVDVIDELLMAPSEPPREVEEEIGPLDTASIVAEVLGRLEYMIEERGARVVLPNRWPVAMGHAPWVEEIWVNLLNNAIRYGGEPPVVKLGAEKEGDTIRFWVRDNGPGLAPEEQVRLFAPGDRSQISEYGLGLELVRRVVQRIGGEVGVESEVGEGSLFYFTLPAAS